MANWAKVLGTGMTTYSNIMDEKRQQEWMDKKEQLAYDRQQALEGLRSSNNTKLADTQYERANANRIEQRDFEAGQLGKEREYQKGIRQEERGYQEGQKASELASQKSLFKWKTDFANDQITEKEAIELEVKEKNWQEMVDSGMMNNWSEEKIASAKAAYKFGFSPTTSKATKPTEAVWKLAGEWVDQHATKGMSTEDYKASVKDVAYGLTQDPEATMAKLQGDSSGDIVDIQALSSLSKDDPAKFNKVLGNLKKKLPPAEYRKIEKQVKKPSTTKSSLASYMKTESLNPKIKELLKTGPDLTPAGEKPLGTSAMDKYRASKSKSYTQ